MIYSADDSILTKQNIILLDNFTNYNRPSVDYFDDSFDSYSHYANSFLLLSKYTQKRKKNLRLPSCSSEDELDYFFYIGRLTNCVFRRWSIHVNPKINVKINPLDINWNREMDTTVLYGPDLTNRVPTGIPSLLTKGTNASSSSSSLKRTSSGISTPSSSTWSSPLQSCVASKSTVSKCLHFNELVLKKVIYDQWGNFYESHTLINDILPKPSHNIELSSHFKLISKAEHRLSKKHSNNQNSILDSTPRNSHNLDNSSTFLNFPQNNKKELMFVA